MKVLLLRPVPSLGRSGQIVEVSDAQARNFLLPKKLAVVATATVLVNYQKQEQQQHENHVRRQNELTKLVAQLNGLTLRLNGQASPPGKLFAALKTVDFQQALERQSGLKLPGLRTKPDHLKTLGTHAVEIIIDGQPAGKINVIIGHG